MATAENLKKSKKSSVTSKVEKLVEAKLKDNQVEDLEKISVVWSAMLDLETPMLPSQAAALLCVSDLVRATTLIDSEKHWIEASMLAIIGAHADQVTISKEDIGSLLDQDEEEPQNKIGFAGSSSNQH